MRRQWESAGLLGVLVFGWSTAIRSARHSVIGILTINGDDHLGANATHAIDGRPIDVGYHRPMVQALVEHSGGAELVVTAVGRQPWILATFAASSSRTTLSCRAA